MEKFKRKISFKCQTQNIVRGTSDWIDNHELETMNTLGQKNNE